MKTFTLLVAFLSLSLSVNAQVTYADLMKVTKTLDQTTEESPEAYREITDIFLSRSLYIGHSNTGKPTPRLPSGSPAPGGLSVVLKPKTELSYRHPEQGNNETVSITSERGDPKDPKKAYFFEYSTKLITYNFAQYVLWRTDALTALKPVKDSYEPFIDTFNLPEKDKETIKVVITQGYIDNSSDDRSYNPNTFYTLEITRTVRN